MSRTLGILRDIAALLAAAVFVLGVWILSNLFARQALRRMSAGQRLSPAAVPLHEPASLAVSVTNASHWPVPLLEWSAQLPDGVAAEVAPSAVGPPVESA